MAINMNWLSKWSPQVYALLRFVAGMLFLCHGLQKVFGVMGGQVMTEGLPFIAGYIELIGGGMIMLGLMAGPAAFICSGQMAVAYFMAHAPQGFWPVENKGELAVLYCFIFLYVATQGSGAYSLDSLLKRKK